jgi:CheY-like chemotaxis protein
MSNAKLNILLVDDEQDLLELCADAFDMEGHIVTGCLSGPQALELLSNTNFDVIISDSKMPEMSGEQFYSKAKELLGEKLPPFFLSSGAIDLDEDGLRSQGVHGFIAKPYDIDDMINQVVKGATGA